jgi:signal transduction histidine kinase
VTQLDQDPAQPLTPLELLRSLHELGPRLAVLGGLEGAGVEAAIEEAAHVTARALTATRQRGDRVGPEEHDVRLCSETLRYSGRVGACRLRADVPEPFLLFLPIRRAAAPFELLVFQRRSALSELEQSAAELAASLLEAALRQRALAAELRDSRTQLEQSERLKCVGQLASGVAHDFNNLLMVVSAAAEVMRDTLAPAHPCSSHLGLIVETSHRAAELTRKLLAFSRKGPAVMKPANVHDVLGTVREFLAHGIDRRITLQLSLCDGACVVDADSTQLGSAILNVCLNGRDAMPDGGLLEISTSRVELDAESCSARFAGCEPGPFLRLDIRDTGAGMDAPTLARAFEPFFTTKEPGRGTGLGLSVVLAAVREHKGVVLLDSAPGRGTTCSILLPLNAHAHAEPGSGPPESRRMAALRVLLVDDEPGVCLTAAQLLRKLGHNVQALCSSAKALSHLRVHSSGYDLLVLDVMMPHPTGPALHRALSLEGIDLPTLFMSGSAELDAFGPGMQGGEVCLPKPFRQADLALAIARCMEAWQSRAVAALVAPLRAG